VEWLKVEIQVVVVEYQLFAYLRLLSIFCWQIVSISEVRSPLVHHIRFFTYLLYLVVTTVIARTAVNVNKQWTGILFITYQQV